MAANKLDINRWFDHGVIEGYGYLLVITDEFDHDDYPVHVRTAAEVHEKLAYFEKASMQKVQEVYDLRADRAEQMAQRWCWRVPKKEPQPPQELFILAVNDDKSQVMLMTPGTKRIWMWQDVLPDLDGPEVAIATAAAELVRKGLLP